MFNFNELDEGRLIVNENLDNVEINVVSLNIFDCLCILDNVNISTKDYCYEIFLNGYAADINNDQLPFLYNSENKYVRLENFCSFTDSYYDKYVDNFINDITNIYNTHNIIKGSHFDESKMTYYNYICFSFNKTTIMTIIDKYLFYKDKITKTSDILLINEDYGDSIVKIFPGKQILDIYALSEAKDDEIEKFILNSKSLDVEYKDILNNEFLKKIFFDIFNNISITSEGILERIKIDDHISFYYNFNFNGRYVNKKFVFYLDDNIVDKNDIDEKYYLIADTIMNYNCYTTNVNPFTGDTIFDIDYKDSESIKIKKYGNSLTQYIYYKLINGYWVEYMKDKFINEVNDRQKLVIKLGEE